MHNHRVGEYEINRLGVLTRKTLWVYFVLFLAIAMASSTAYSQKIYAIDQSVEVVSALPGTSATSNYLLFVHTSYYCGHCRFLLRDMAGVTLPDNLKVVFMYYDTPEEKIIENTSKYKGQEVRKVNAPRSEWQVKLFPTSQLVHAADSSQVKIIKGYHPKKYWNDVVKRTRK